MDDLSSIVAKQKSTPSGTSRSGNEAAAGCASQRVKNGSPLSWNAALTAHSEAMCALSPRTKHLKGLSSQMRGYGQGSVLTAVGVKTTPSAVKTEPPYIRCPSYCL